jgi:hypothetical protein
MMVLVVVSGRSKWSVETKADEWMDVHSLQHGGSVAIATIDLSSVVS